MKDMLRFLLLREIHEITEAMSCRKIWVVEGSSRNVEVDTEGKKRKGHSKEMLTGCSLHYTVEKEMLTLLAKRERKDV